MLYFSICSLASAFRTFYRITTLLLVTIWIFPGAAQATPPENDAFSNATVISNASGTISGSNIDATSETGEPENTDWGTPGQSVWYKWVAPSSDKLDFDTQGSNFNTVIAIYTGPALSSLSSISENNDDFIFRNRQSRLSFTPAAGETYYIVVDGLYGQSGNLKLNWGPAPPTISGTISLPAGDIAPAGGIDFFITLSNPNNNNYREDYRWVSIDAGMNSATYNLFVTSGTEDSLEVDFRCDSDCDAYVQWGYYNIGGTTWNPEMATLLPGNEDHPGIGLVLLTGNTITGTVSLPDTEIAPAGGISIHVTSYDGRGNGGGRYTTVIVTAGQSSAPYRITLPIDASVNWVISYSCITTCAGYFNSGYYAGVETTWATERSLSISGGDNHSSINMTLIRSKQISGSIRLPAGELAHIDLPVQITISAKIGNTTTFLSASAVIEAGHSFALYSEDIPLDASTHWRLGYACWQCEQQGYDYVLYGYSSGEETSWMYREAVLLPGDDHHTDKNLSLIAGKPVSGTISLPATELAPEYGIELTIAADRDGSPTGAHNYVSIAEGEHTTSYHFIVPTEAGTHWFIGYQCRSNCDNYFKKGYYMNGITTADWHLATLLPSGYEHSNISLTMLAGNTIRGKVSLPGNDTAGKGITVEIGRQYSSIIEYSRDLSIRRGTNSGTYVLTLPRGITAQWWVRYSCWGLMGSSDCGIYVDNGYYSDTGTTPNKDEASLLTAGLNHANVDLTLLKEEQEDALCFPVMTPKGQISIICL